jgi:hypothetical protein
MIEPRHLPADAVAEEPAMAENIETLFAGIVWRDRRIVYLEHELAEAQRRLALRVSLGRFVLLAYAHGFLSSHRR